VGLAGAIAFVLALAWTAIPSSAAVTLPILWEAGGLSAGTFSAGQAARIASDAAGNVTVISGPADATGLRVTSYTASGQLRWVTSVSPSIGTFQGDWVAAAPGGDVVAVGHNVTSRGSPIAITLIRLAPDGTLRWRVDIARTFPNVARLLVDAQGNAYLAFNSAVDGQDIQVHKYDVSGTLLWSRLYSPGGFSNEVASSMALSPDQTEVVVSASVSGGAQWIVASFDGASGAQRWVNASPVGVAARDVTVDGTRVYVTGQGNVGIESFLTVVAYARSNGAQQWRTDSRPATNFSGAAGLRIALAPDGSLVATGRSGLFLDWYTVALGSNGSVRWTARRDGRSDLDEVPVGVFVLPSGTAVVTGPGGPALPGGYIQGVTVGYGPDGTLLWESFARLATVWAVPLPNGDVCATGGYDALVTCWRIGGSANQPPVAAIVPASASGAAPLTVHFDGRESSDPDGTVTSWQWDFGDGSTGSGSQVDHVYTTPGSYTATLTVADGAGATDDATASITATGASTFDLTVARAGAGSGRVRSADGRINCGSDCSETYAAGTLVTLSARASRGSLFTGWSGACSGVSTTCVVTMNAAKGVTATFTRA
jgi:PKD repeat protein